MKRKIFAEMVAPCAQVEGALHALAINLNSDPEGAKDALVQDLLETLKNNLQLLRLHLIARRDGLVGATTVTEPATPSGLPPLDSLTAQPIVAPPAEELLSEREAAQLIGVSASCLTRWRLDDKGPPHVWFGKRKLRYKKVEVEQWAAQNGPRAVSGHEVEEEDEGASAEEIAAYLAGYDPQNDLRKD